MGKPSEQPESVDDDVPETTETDPSTEVEDAPEPDAVEPSAAAPSDEDAQDEDEDSEDDAREIEAGSDDGLDAAVDETSVAPRQRTHVRNLTRWYIPFHYAPALIVTALGIAMLVVGGTVGWFGGWWLAAALPIAIGAFLRSIWFAAIPMIVWGGWLIYAGGADETADLSNTPTLLGVCLGLIGTGATVLAQRAVFPATEPGAWEASAGRLVPPLDDGETSPFDDHPDDHTIEFAVVEPIEASEEELEAAAVAAMGEATIAEVALPDAESAADPERGTDGAVAEFEALAPDRAEDAEDGDETGDADDETDDADDETDDADDETDDAGDETDEAGDEADDADEAAHTDGDAADPDAAAHEEEPEIIINDAEPQVETETAGVQEHPETPVTEASLDADPSQLDEGGHPTEFRAITDDDLARAETSDA